MKDLTHLHDICITTESYDRPTEYYLIGYLYDGELEQCFTQEKLVLFRGVPCEIRALKSYLGRDDRICNDLKLVESKR